MKRRRQRPRFAGPRLFTTVILVLAFAMVAPGSALTQASPTPAIEVEATVTIHLQLHVFNRTLDKMIDCESNGLTIAEKDACEVFPPVTLDAPVDPLTGGFFPAMWFRTPGMSEPAVVPTHCDAYCERCGIPDGCAPPPDWTRPPNSYANCNSNGCYGECGGIGPGQVSCSVAFTHKIYWSNLGYWTCSSNCQGGVTTGVIHHQTGTDYEHDSGQHRSFRNGVDAGCSDSYGNVVSTATDLGTFSQDACSSGDDGTGNPNGNGAWGISISGR